MTTDRLHVAGRSRLAIVAASIYSLEATYGHLVQSALKRGNAVLCLAPGLPIGIAASGPLAGASTFNLVDGAGGREVQTFRLGSKQLDAAFGDWHPDTVLACDLAVLPAVVRAARRIRVTNISCAVLANAAEPGMPRRPIPWLQRRRISSALRQAHAIVLTDSDQQHSLAREGIAVPRDRVHEIAGPGIDLDDYQEVVLPEISDGVRVLVVAESVVTGHRAALAEAAALLRERHPGVRVVLAVPSPPGEHTGESKAVDDPAPLVEIALTTDELPDEVRRAHVVIELGAATIYPRSALLALAIGRPLIVRSVPGLGNLVDERVNGIQLTDATPATIVAGIENLLHRPDLFPSMARASRAKALRSYQAKRFTSSILKLLDLR